MSICRDYMTSPVCVLSFSRFSNFSRVYFVALLYNSLDLFCAASRIYLMGLMLWLEMDTNQNQNTKQIEYILENISTMCPVGKYSSYLIYLCKILLVVIVSGTNSLNNITDKYVNIPISLWHKQWSQYQDKEMLVSNVVILMFSRQIFKTLRSSVRVLWRYPEMEIFIAGNSFHYSTLFKIQNA